MLGTNACGHTTRPRCLWGDLLKEPVGDEPHGFLTGLPEKGTARSRLCAARFVAPVEASLVLLARAWSWNLHPQGWMASNDYGTLLPERYLWEQMLGEKQFRAASSTFQDSLLSTALITHTHTLACTANFYNPSVPRGKAFLPSCHSQKGPPSGKACQGHPPGHLTRGWRDSKRKVKESWEKRQSGS